MSGRTVSLHVCASLSRRVHHNKLAVDRDFKKKHKNMFPILTQSFIQLFTSLIEGKIVYYESTKRKLQTKYICECRCYERLQTKTKEFTRLSHTELVLELEHLKIETRLITEMFANVMGECEN